MPIRTAICDLLAIEHPVISAPMAGISGGGLAAAASGAGGLGLIGGGYGDEAWLERELDAAGNARIGVGFISWALERQPDLLDIALDRAPVAIFLSFGNVRQFAPRIVQSSARLIVQVQSLAQARAAASEGADVIVAQGTEAGGHGARRATLPLIPAVVDAVGTVPVMAAGGIADGRGLAAALMLGASGVVCGTVFYASQESLAHPNAKRAAVNASGDHTERSSIFDIARGLDWPNEWNLRTMQNSFTRQWSADPDGLERSIECERARYVRARDEGDVNIAPVIVGEAVDLVRTIEPAGAILDRMVSEAEHLLHDAPELLSLH